MRTQTHPKLPVSPYHWHSQRQCHHTSPCGWQPSSRSSPRHPHLAGPNPLQDFVVKVWLQALFQIVPGKWSSVPVQVILWSSEMETSPTAMLRVIFHFEFPDRKFLNKSHNNSTVLKCPACRECATWQFLFIGFLILIVVRGVCVAWATCDMARAGYLQLIAKLGTFRAWFVGQQLSQVLQYSDGSKTLILRLHLGYNLGLTGLLSRYLDPRGKNQTSVWNTSWKDILGIPFQLRGLLVIIILEIKTVVSEVPHPWPSLKWN